jgi:pilus assembly protein Flp/PilA
MTAQIQYVRALLNSRNEDGASAVEYGLLVAAIAAVIAAIVFLLGGNILDAFTTTNDCVDQDAGTAC